MKLRVLIIGSDQRQFDDLEKRPDAFTSFCHGLGSALARKGHQIVVLSDNEKYADKFVLKGYLEKEQGRKLPPVVLYEVSGHPERFEQLRKVSLTKFKRLRTDDDHPFNRIGTVRDVDAIVVVGGHREAAAMVKLGEIFGKPLIPIKEFEGVALAIWKTLKTYYHSILVDPSETLKAIDKHYEDTYDRRGDDVVKIIEARVRADRKKTILPFLLGMELLAFVGGFALIMTGRNYAQIAIPLLILAMATFGIVLRFLVKLLLDPDQQLPIRGFFLELGLGVALAVIYYFLFRIGGASIAGDLDEAMKEGPFEAVAIVISILTIGVSFLLEESLERTRKKLSSATL